MPLLFAVAGNTSAFNVLVVPVVNDISFSIFMLVTGCVTSTLHVAYTLLPSLALAVIVVIPFLCAVTFPFVSILAILLSLDDHSTSLLLASLGLIVLFIILVFPGVNTISFSLNVISVTSCITVTLHVALFH